MTTIQLTSTNETWLNRHIQTSKFRRVSLVGITVTPDLAKEMLARNEGNRVKRVAHVGALAQAIKSGDWIETGDTIKFDTNGRLLDGQHRLSAIIQANTSVVADVVFGVTPEAFDRIDTGMARTHSQILAMVGIKDGPLLTSATRVLLALNRGLSHAGSVSASKHEVVEFIKANHDLIASARVAERVRKAIGRIASPGGLTAAVYLINKRVGTDITPFIDQLCSGAGLNAESPILALRNRFIRSSGKARNKIDGVEATALVIKAFNAWHEGRPMKQLSWRVADEEFPVVGG